MTREEIINGLRMNMELIKFDPSTGNVRPIYTLNDLDKTTYVACKEAIEALKAQADLQQSCNNLATDCISRQDAIDAIDKLSDEPIGYLEAAIDALVDLPSAQPERKTGEWIWKLDEGDPDRSMMLVCSICDSGRDEVGTYNFCHICGTKMINPRGEQDGTD